MEINQIDVVTALLYGFLDKVIYMEQPHSLTDGSTKVCKLLSLYGLEQSPRMWFETLPDYLKGIRLTSFAA